MVDRCLPADSRQQSDAGRQHYCYTREDSLTRVTHCSPFTNAMSAVAVVILACCWSVVSLVHSCYVFPPEMTDPCLDKRCSFGAQCVPSLDGLTARCQCPQRCDSYGDSVSSAVTAGVSVHSAVTATVTVSAARRSAGQTDVTMPTRARCDELPAAR